MLHAHRRHARVGLALLSALIALLLAACGTAPETASSTAPSASAAQATNLRITVWTGNEDHLKLLNDIAAEYRTTHPNVSVQFDTIAFADYNTKLTTQLAGGNPPDAGWLVETSAPTFIDAGVVVDLGPALKNSADYNYADFAQPAMQLWTKGDALYGVPFSNSPFFILYNRDLFAAAGIETPDALAAKNAWTWDALATAAKAIADAAEPGVFGFESTDAGVYGERVWYTLAPIIRAYGGDAWDANGTQCGLNSPEAVAAVQLYHQMAFADKSAVPPGEQADFFGGKAGMTIGQLSRVAKLKDATFAWGIAPLPSGPAGQAAMIGQGALAVFNASRNRDAAIDFVRFMTDRAHTEQMARFFPPARVSVLESPTFVEANPKIDPLSLKTAVVDAAKVGTVAPSHVNFPKIDLAARAEFDKLWLADADVKAVLDGTCAAITPLLSE